MNTRIARSLIVFLLALAFALQSTTIFGQAAAVNTSAAAETTADDFDFGDFDLDSLFEDESALEIDEGEVIENPEARLFAENSFTWAGDFYGKAGTILGWESTPSSLSDLNSFDDALTADLKLRLWFDARPDRHFRVFGKFVTGWPFSQTILTVDPTSSTGFSNANIPNISVFEIFADFNWEDTVFFRFGKQTSGWGLSRFYQIGDLLSVAVKDPANPTEDLEGPVALRISYPLGVHTLYAVTALKDSYLPTDGTPASVGDLGFGIKGDFLISVPKNPIISNGELSLGAWYQKNLAPKFVAGYSTGIGNFQIFTDQLLTWGLDSVRVGDSTKRDSDLFWSATLGSMYVQNDWHFTAYGEYLFSGPGSTDKDVYALFLERLAAEYGPGATLPPTLNPSDIGGFLSRHNSALSLSWSELFGTDKLSFSALWLQNWVDRSGTTNGKIRLSPFKHFAIETGLSFSWGGSSDEWIIKTGNFVTKEPVRTSASLAFILGSGKF